MPGSLHVVSTPIGNLDDITLRALSTLKSVGLIAAEDTRRTGILLRHFGISTPSTSLHEHNERQKAPWLLRKLAEGVDIALVSDAGTPLVADPGQRLIAAAIEQGVRVIPIPGASALLSALVASGFRADEFVFGGFPPTKSNDRKRWLSALQGDSRPIVFFEAPHRIARTLSELGGVFGERPISISRELTKLHEETIRTTARDAGGMALTARGEFTVVIGPSTKQIGALDPPEPSLVASTFDQLTKSGTLTRRRAAAETGRVFGLSTNDVYAILEQLKPASPS